MADPAFYEAEEDDLLSSLAAPQYGQPEAASYEDEYKRMQVLEQHAYAQHGEQAQGDGELGVQLEMVPEDVKRVG
jgi:translation initiation factor 3 subunit L